MSVSVELETSGYVQSVPYILVAFTSCMGQNQIFDAERRETRPHRVMACQFAASVAGISRMAKLGEEIGLEFAMI